MCATLDEINGAGRQPSFEELLKITKDYKMTPEEEREQRISFAYGNAVLANPNITREMVEEVARELDAQK